MPNSLGRSGVLRSRNRLHRLSESMMRILGGNNLDSKHRLHTSAQTNSYVISRIVVFLLLLSTLIVSITTVVNFLAPKRYGYVSKPKTTSLTVTELVPPSFSSLSVQEYPSVLVSESEDFKATGVSTDKDEGQSSLVASLSDDEVTHASRFDSAEEPVARLIVITMDRDHSLKRLLNSLEKANYGEDHVNLDIWIDRADDKPINSQVLQTSRDLDWKYGTKSIHKRAKNAGLYQQWIYTWNITAETTEFAVILEDDLEVSVSFYQWLRNARATYAQDPDVGAFTLQRSTLRPRQIRGVASGSLRIPDNHHLFKYKLLGTWGFAPQRDIWVEFRKWFEEKRTSGEKPYVKNLITTEWYKSQEKDGFAPTMWSQWWIKFVDEKGYFTVTPHLPNGTTLASNWREKGLHYSKNKASQDFPLFKGNEEMFQMTESIISVDWDGRIIPPTTNQSL